MEETQREELRTKHQVRPVTDAEEGSGVGRLPGGVYGFTYAPGPREFPLFKASRSQTFEVHKLPDGTIELVGFVRPAMAAQIETATEPLGLKVFPAPREDATALVSIPFTRVIRFKEHSARDGGGLDLQIEPKS